MQIKKEEREDVVKQHKRLLGEGLIIAIILMGMVGNFTYSNKSLSRTLIELVKPQAAGEPMKLHFLSKGIFLLTDIDPREPTTWMTSILPRFQNGKKINGQLEVISGYFSQDENSYLSKEEQQTSEMQVEQETEMTIDEQYAIEESLTHLEDLSEVYRYYFSAAGKMDFGLDMLERWDFKELAKKPLFLKEGNGEPQILIFHTHARETYTDGTSVVEVGEVLKQTLEAEYGVSVLHVTDEFYEESNKTAFPTKGEYERMEKVMSEVIKAHPSISVVMDIHRDGVKSDVHLVTDVDGKPTAKIMFVNGLCLNRNLEGEVEDKEALPNPYLADNLAFSLQNLITMNTYYPGLSRKIYLNEWRFSTHMCSQSLLIEWGAQTNSGEEAMNAVVPFARVLMSVLQKE